MLRLNNDQTMDILFHKKEININNPVMILSDLFSGLIKLFKNSEDFSINFCSDKKDYIILFSLLEITVLELEKNNKYKKNIYKMGYDVLEEIYNDIKNDINNWSKLFDNIPEDYLNEFFTNLKIIENILIYINNTEPEIYELSLAEVISNLYLYDNKEKPLIYVIDFKDVTRTATIGKYYNKEKMAFKYTIKETYSEIKEYTEETFVSALFNIPGLNNHINFRIN